MQWAEWINSLTEEKFQSLPGDIQEKLIEYQEKGMRLREYDETYWKPVNKAIADNDVSRLIELGPFPEEGAKLALEIKNLAEEIAASLPEMK